jgi:hypothetical protein
VSPQGAQATHVLADHESLLHFIFRVSYVGAVVAATSGCILNWGGGWEEFTLDTDRSSYLRCRSVFDCLDVHCAILCVMLWLHRLTRRVQF